jgi:hypothetical protein
MAKTLCVRLNVPAPELVHVFRNLGEGVWGALRDECDISLAEIDASTSEFHLRGIHTRDLRTVAARLRTLVEKSGMGSQVTVTEVVPEDE